MARGFVGGVIAGAVVSGVALGVVSVLSGKPDDLPPEAVAVEVPAGSEFDQSREDTAASLPAMDETPQAASAPQVGTPAPDDLDGLDGTDTQPAARPETGLAEGDLSAPQVPAGAQDGDTQDESPAMLPPASDDVAAPAADPAADPAQEEDLSISVDPAQPTPPAADEGEEAVFARPPAPEPAETGQEAPQTEVSPSSDLPETEPDVAADTPPPSGTIGNLAEGVATNRLPSITDAPGAEQQEATGERPAIERNAMPFDNTEAKPLMAIVLIDDGTSPIGLEALKDFPYPLSFAIDPRWTGAAAAAERYRAAGFEVLAMADLPPGAQPADTETVMQTVLSTLPDAVAILEGTGDGLQSGREAAEQLAPILLESGHGLVMFPKGLDTAQKLIRREGVPAATIFRDFDSNGQNETVIRRFLDQASFKASREEGGVIMLGRLRADTITALLLWGLQDRANRVALAPISAVLTGR